MTRKIADHFTRFGRGLFSGGGGDFSYHNFTVICVTLAGKIKLTV